MKVWNKIHTSKCNFWLIFHKMINHKSMRNVFGATKFQQKNEPGDTGYFCVTFTENQIVGAS